MRPAPGPALVEAPLRREAPALFAALRQGAARSVFLDSAARGPDARWSYLAAGDLPLVEGSPVLATLAKALGPGRARIPGAPPFVGGLVGVLGYDVAAELERLPSAAHADLSLPKAWWVRVDEFLALDHAEGRVVAVAWPAQGEHAKDAEARAAALLHRAHRPVRLPTASPGGGRARSNAGAQGYEDMVRRGLRHIAAGDVYQVNLAHRLTWPSDADPFALHLRLREGNPSPFAFFLDAGPWQLVSCSPERLLRVQGRDVATRPIAGTYPRGATAAEDEALAARLRSDPKERAEHTMLVDLERNDLGRVCEPGSIRWDEFMTVEGYSHVNHLVSKVAGTLQPGLGALDATRALFPGGTITGVPKVRAMEVIDAIEPARRGFYTGSAGWLGYDGDADLNIVIRTLLCTDGLAHASVGAGIVADSDPAREWRETLHKAAALLRAAGVEGP